MGTFRPQTRLFRLLLTFLIATFFLQGFATRVLNTRGNDISKGLLIGSTAPNCTYNECRGCKYKCRAERIPVDANDPINSAYHYRCVCHRCQKFMKLLRKSLDLWKFLFLRNFTEKYRVLQPLLYSRSFCYCGISHKSTGFYGFFSLYFMPKVSW
ncbi:hypothetical protein GIB67_002741 [Kingdonia uniflora]|uniref:Stomagen C-terminal domain-containing protein n=1 Tax=Kingdonia uniflora TaxID=39325 RepID=A0A7J7N4X3_9MAGN|nr:hypothetical protein GIB67_002741 [Kingdonia uniflora]